MKTWRAIGEEERCGSRRGRKGTVGIGVAKIVLPGWWAGGMAWTGLVKGGPSRAGLGSGGREGVWVLIRIWLIFDRIILNCNNKPNKVGYQKAPELWNNREIFKKKNSSRIGQRNTKKSVGQIFWRLFLRNFCGNNKKKMLQKKQIDLVFCQLFYQDIQSI